MTRRPDDKKEIAALRASPAPAVSPAPRTTMSVINAALLFHFGRSLSAYGFIDNVARGTSGVPKPLKSEASQITAAGTGNSYVLRSIARGEVAGPEFLINNGASAASVAPAPGETINGGSTPLSVPANQSAICIPDLSNSGVSSLDWRCAVLS
jgi:hypothetical protein